VTVPAQVIAALVPILHVAEGCELQAYWDATGKVWTIGWGHTGLEVVQGLVWTQDQCDAQLSLDLQDHWDELVASLATVSPPLSAGRMAALLDFVYNEGIGNFQSSTLRKRLLLGTLDDVPTELMKWDLSGGQVLAGLIRRRKAECALWSQG
jgi:lysozyme